MDWNIKKLTFCFLVFAVCSSSHVFGQNLETDYPSQNYDLVKLVGNFAEHISTSKNLKSISEEEKEFLNGITDIVPSELRKKLLKLFLQLSSNTCFRDLQNVYEGLKKRTGWSLKMLDSFGKPESGILLGNVKWLGEYDECLGVEAPNFEGTTIGGFRGKYCTLQIPLNLNNMSLPISTAVCLPDSCNPKGTIASIFGNIFKDFSFNNFTSEDLMEAVFGNMTLTCQPTTRTMSAGAITVICFLSLLALLALIGSSITAFEYYTKSDQSNGYEHVAGVNGKQTINGDLGMTNDGSVEVPVSESRQEIKLPAWVEMCKPFFNCFCIFTNGEKILNVENSEGQLPSLHGIRFLSMSWVMLCHTYAFTATHSRNMVETMQFLDHWFLQIVLNGFYSVDSFFLLSGFLVAYLFFQQCAKSNGKFPWVYFYVHRYIRLTPVYGIVMLFYIFVNPYIADGPIWGGADKNCDDNWWYNLLYINNFIPSSRQCVGWAWYLANDMQFYVISPLFLITLWRWPKVGYSLIGGGLLITFITNLTLSLVYDTITGLGNIVEAATDLQGFLDKWNVFFEIIYIKPYNRVGPYLLGLALAYYLYQRKQSNAKKLKLTTLAAGWAIASAITLSCLFGLYHQNLSTVGAAFYTALNRIGFALGLSWVIFVCVIGQGDVVNNLLSWKVWIPLSRLTYCAYLIHPIVQNGYNNSIRRLIEFSNFSAILFYLGFLIISYTAALVTTLLFESPVIRLEKYIRTKFS